MGSIMRQPDNIASAQPTTGRVTSLREQVSPIMDGAMP